MDFSIPEQQKGNSQDSSAVVDEVGGKFCACGIISRERLIISRECRIISREPRGAGRPDLYFQRDVEEWEAAGKAVTQEQFSGERTAPAFTATRPEVADRSAGAVCAHPAVLF